MKADSSLWWLFLNQLRTSVLQRIEHPISQVLGTCLRLVLPSQILTKNKKVKQSFLLVLMEKLFWWTNAGKTKSAALVYGSHYLPPLSVIKSNRLSSCLKPRPLAKPPTTVISPGPRAPFNHVRTLHYCGRTCLYILGIAKGEGRRE